jgi:hypothetical protein
VLYIINIQIPDFLKKSGIYSHCTGSGGHLSYEATVYTRLTTWLFNAKRFLACLINPRAKREPTVGMVAPPGMSNGTAAEIVLSNVPLHNSLP